MLLFALGRIWANHYECQLQRIPPQDLSVSMPEIPLIYSFDL